MRAKKLTTWIVITDGAKGQIVVNDGPGLHLSSLSKFNSDGARQRGQDLVSDREGRSFDRGAKGRHAMEPHTNAKQVEKDKFVRSIVDQVKKGRLSGSFDQLVLIADPSALGVLRKAFSEDVIACVVSEINKDLTNLHLRDLKDHLVEIRL